MNQPSKSPLYLVHGKLGAGKTSVITHLSQTERFQHAYVIENEFASENLDGAVLSEHVDRTSIFEISGGCICCSSGAELLDVLQRIAERPMSPSQAVIIETTGVASSTQLLKSLFLSDVFHTHFYLAKNILVLDALETDPSMLSELRLDIGLADMVVLNKKDLASDAKLADFKDRIRTINPDLHCILAKDGVFDTSILNNADVSCAEDFLVEHISDIADALAINHAADIEYRIIPVRQPTSKAAVETYLDTLKKSKIQLYRVKGHLKDLQGAWWRIECTPNHAFFHASSEVRSPKIVAIGKGLPPDMFPFIT